MKKKRKIIVTGGCGYIGTMVCRELLENGHEVLSIDILQFGNEGFNYNKKFLKFRFIHDDYINFKKILDIYKSYDTVIHLAAISGMPSCDKYKKKSNKINYLNVKKYFNFLNKQKNIKKIFFASSTSVFGINEGISDEKTKCKPISNYGIQKLNCEKLIKSLDKKFKILRFPTIFGFSFRMRFDLTINEFCRYINMNKEFKVFNIKSFRPYCHIDDLKIVIRKIIEHDINIPSPLCIGDEKFNLNKYMILKILKKNYPGVEKLAKYVEIKDIDKRNYNVSFQKFKNAKIHKFNSSLNNILIDLVKDISRIKTKRLTYNLKSEW